MTFQPPPPPPGTPPPPPGGTPPPPPGPPGGQWGPPPGGTPGGSGGFDPKSVNPLDWGIIGAGFLVFLFSFIDFYDGGTVTVSGKDVDIPDAYSEGFSAWHGIVGGGFFGWFAMIFALAGAAAVAASLFAPQIKLPLPARVLSVAGFGAAAVFEIISIFVTPGYDVPSIAGDVDSSAGHGFGFWVSLILIIAGTVLSIMRAQQTNTVLPGPLANIPKIGK